MECIGGSTALIGQGDGAASLVEVVVLVVPCGVFNVIYLCFINQEATLKDIIYDNIWQVFHYTLCNEIIELPQNTIRVDSGLQ
ncbi:MAG TPA: hypothetical protein GX520_11635 [Syntrophaceticus sp.]|nr:hypothetical protein [Syntrophaceticus sp.]